MEKNASSHVSAVGVRNPVRLWWNPCSSPSLALASVFAFPHDVPCRLLCLLCVLCLLCLSLSRPRTSNPPPSDPIICFLWSCSAHMHRFTSASLHLSSAHHLAAGPHRISHTVYTDGFKGNIIKKTHTQCKQKFGCIIMEAGSASRQLISLLAFYFFKL